MQPETCGTEENTPKEILNMFYCKSTIMNLETFTAVKFTRTTRNSCRKCDRYYKGDSA